MVDQEASEDHTDSLRRHLASSRVDPRRVAQFEMDDEPDVSFLAGGSILTAALQYLGENLQGAWSESDAKAIKHRKTHQLIARISIVSGMLAIIAAVVLLAFLRDESPVKGTVFVIEIAVAVVAGLAVISGLIAKSDHKWLTHRCHAERIKMLKFRALAQPSLWTADQSGWTDWVVSEIEELQSQTGFDQIKQWAESGAAEVTPPLDPELVGRGTDSSQLVSYYKHKRLLFQADYFRGRSEQRGRQVRFFQHLSHPFFFVSLVCVAVHAFLDLALESLNLGPSMTHRLEFVSLLAVIFAAVFPILGFGSRAWTGALEDARSVTLFKAKHQALTDVANRMEADRDDLSKTCQHIANVEHFLEEEHREWLRLLLKAEWFI